MRKTGQQGPSRGLRIVGGEWRGRRLDVLPGTGVRPTPDRVRETLFNWLAAHVAGARCLDLFAGTGALGLEALSRGASEAVFVERDRALASALERLVESLGARGRVVSARAEPFLASYEGAPFDLAFLDPPYDERIEPLVTAVARVLRPGSFLYVERRKPDGLPEIPWGLWHRVSSAGAVVYGLRRATMTERSPPRPGS